MAEITAKDECIKICEAIWSCQNEEQKNGCYNMFETYKKKHGEENVGVTFIEVELARLEKLIVKMKERQQKQQELTQQMTEQRQKELQKEVNDKTKKKSVATFNKKEDKIIPLNSKQNKTE